MCGYVCHPRSPYTSEVHARDKATPGGKQHGQRFCRWRCSTFVTVTAVVSVFAIHPAVCSIAASTSVTHKYSLPEVQYLYLLFIAAGTLRHQWSRHHQRTKNDVRYLPPLIPHASGAGNLPTLPHPIATTVDTATTDQSNKNNL